MNGKWRRTRSIRWFGRFGGMLAVAAGMAGISWVSAEPLPRDWGLAEERFEPSWEPPAVQGWARYGLSVGVLKLSGESEAVPSAVENQDESGFGSSLSLGLLFQHEGRPQVAVAVDLFSVLEGFPHAVWSSDAPGESGFEGAVGEATIAVYLNNQEAVTFSYGREAFGGRARVVGASPPLLGPDGSVLAVGDTFAVGQRLESFRIGYQMAEAPLTPRGHLMVDPQVPDIAMGFRAEAGVGRLTTVDVDHVPGAGYRAEVEEDHWGMVFAARAGGETPLTERLAMYGVLGGDLFLGSTGYGSVFGESGLVYRAGLLEWRVFLAGTANLESFYGSTAEGTYAANFGAWEARLGMSAGLRF